MHNDTSSESSAATMIKVEKSVKIVDNRNVDDRNDESKVAIIEHNEEEPSHVNLGARMSVHDMEASLKRELSSKRKDEGAPAPAAPQAAPASAPAQTEEAGKQKKKKDEDSCCIIS